MGGLSPSWRARLVSGTST